MTSHNVDLSRAVWRTSSRSASNGGQCGEVARNLPGMVAVRDSKDRDGSQLIVSTGQWRAFIRATQDGSLEVGAP